MTRILLLSALLISSICSARSPKTFVAENIQKQINSSGQNRSLTVQENAKSSTIQSPYAGISAYQNFKLPQIPSQIYSNDTLIVGLIPNDTLRITGNWTHTGPIWVFNDGVLIFDNANVIDSGDVYVWGNGQLLAESSTLFFPQNYFYERSLLAIGNSQVVLNNCSLNYSGMSHNLVISDSANVNFNNVHQNDWTTCGLWGACTLSINHCNLGGEYILSSYANVHFNKVDTLILWHQLPDTSVINFDFPSTDTVYNYQFDSSVPGVAGVAYHVDADSCTDVMWALMPVNGSNVTINNSTIRAIGAWFTQGDSVTIQNIFNNSNYTSYTAPLTDRILHLNNCSVQTWSMYVFDSSEVNIYNCQLGEVGCQSHASSNSQGFILDGSGGYFWATDTATSFADQVAVYSTVRSERNGIFVLMNSYLPFLPPSAIGSSLLVCVQDSCAGDPVAFDGAIVWNQKFTTPDTAYTDSLLNITGSAWIDQGPQGSWMDFSNYSVYFREISASSLTPLVIDSAMEIRNSTLANWNTNGLTPGLYELSLKIRNNLGDSLSSTRQIVLTSGQNGIAELNSSENYIYPNPATDNIKIVSDNYPVEFELFDNTGKSIEKEIVNSSSQYIPMTKHSAGIYIYQLRDSKQVRLGKLLIQPSGKN
ncbi:MAG: T9SS type A sorting domain-containing protein [Bacteroidetes bacterium]|nr:T9SS type A sorting domain-containing protein [Bacteroidota bacterium]